MSNTFGRLFRITSFGESHGAGIGVVVDGCPAGLKLDTRYIQAELDRRKPGQNRISSQRKEPDEFEILSGHIDHVTTGAPLAFFVRNLDARSGDYTHIEQQFRPSHADYTYFAKYGIRDHRGGGRSSARETISRVIGGAIARLILAKLSDIHIQAWVQAIHEISLDHEPESFELISEFQQAVRCPDPGTAERMFNLIDQVRKEGDSVGGLIACRILHVPPGLGDPVFHKLHADLGAAMLSINAVKGFEIGSGFAGSRMRGSQHNDAFFQAEGQIRTRSNFSGGVQGGISNGMPIRFCVAFKPTSTIMQDQESVDPDGNAVIVKGKGRHDPCVVPRAVPIVEAMAAIVLADALLIQRAGRL
jgi:chorismate synthase